MNVDYLLYLVDIQFLLSWWIEQCHVGKTMQFLPPMTGQSMVNNG